MSFVVRFAYCFMSILLCIEPVFASVPMPILESPQTPIVYSRCARTTESFDVSAEVTIDDALVPASRTMRGLDVYDVLPDVTNFFTNFSAPCDLIYRDSVGVEKILYDCSTTSTDESACAALDPSVSFDGKTIAFSVFRGTLKNHSLIVQHQIIDENADSGYTGYIETPNKKLSTTGAHLHTVDVATGAISAKEFEAGIYDSGPTFLANGRLAFTSNRDKHTSTVVWWSKLSSEGTRIWSIDLNWKNLDLASHHSLSQEQHPYLLKNGRLAYSSWQVLGSQSFRHTNGATGGFTTLGNLFHIYSQFPDGAENFALYGQHSGGHYPSYFGENHTAAHFIAQTSDERVWFADYYRGNNNGFGVLIGVLEEPSGQEGKSPKDVELHSDIFVPNDVINFAPWSHNIDGTSFTLTSPSIKHPGYTDDLVFAGKVGHPGALPDNGLMLSWGKGACSTLASAQILIDLGIEVPIKVNGSGSGVAMNMMTHIDRDVPACDSGIYVATQIPSAHPSDLALVVDSPEWHEIMAKAVIPYNEIHGIDKPADIEKSADKVNHPLLEKGTPFGLLGAASITDRETHPQEGITFAGEHQFSLQGTDTINYSDEDLCGVRILGMMPNRSTNTYQGLSNLFGERVRILGEFSVLNKDEDGKEIIDPSLNADTSFLVRMPANTPYLMQSIDCQGRTLNTDMSWQSLRPGEKKTCGGCHVHSRESRINFEDSFAATDDYQIPRLGEGIIPLLNGKEGGEVAIKEIDGYAMSIDFERDIMPIFEARCTSCHGGAEPVAELALDIPGDNKQRDTPNATWWCLVGDYGQRCLSESNRFDTGKDGYFRRPQVSRYIRAFNSLGSLLYWKAANERTDKNTDESYDDDLDFGVDHPTDITADELGLLSRWIDIGVPGGDDELEDTQKPTLHLVATSTSDESVSTVKIGTVDAGSGINPESLVVCVLNSEGLCASKNLAENANMSGVIVLELNQTISDPTAEILASIEDVTGNKTEIRRTVSYLTNSKNSNITITPIDDAELTEGETHHFTVNVSDSNDVANTITIIASKGVIAPVSDNEYKLIPPDNYDGDIFVMVVVTDDENSSDSDSTSFTVSVTQINEAPTSVIVDVDTSRNVSSGEVEAVVTDPDIGDTHTLTIKSQASNGFVTISGMLVEYVPNNGFFGDDLFEVTVTDNAGLSVDSQINVKVSRNNTAPKSAGALIETMMNVASQPIRINIVDVDTDDSHVISLVSEPTFGSVSINGLLVTYTPQKGFIGNDSFEVLATDKADESVIGTVKVSVLAEDSANNGENGAENNQPGEEDSQPDGDDNQPVEENKGTVKVSVLAEDIVKNGEDEAEDNQPVEENKGTVEVSTLAEDSLNNGENEVEDNQPGGEDNQPDNENTIVIASEVTAKEEDSGGSFNYIFIYLLTNLLVRRCLVKKPLDK